MSTNTSKNLGGFTLVELLVVMAVLTVLAAIILPVTLQARNRANGAVCVSNLKQLGAAVSMYSIDHEGRVPYTPYSPFSGSYPQENFPDASGSYAVAEALMPYIRSSKVFSSPSDKGAPAFGYDSEVATAYESGGTSYRWNVSRTTGKWLVNGVSLSLLNSHNILFQDYGCDWHGVRTRRGMSVSEQIQSNAVYADGHSAPTTTYSLSTSGGAYAAGVTSSEKTDLWIAGTTDYSSAFVYGVVRESSSLVITASGTVYSPDGTQDVSRTFTFSKSTNMKTAVSQIVTWIASLIES